MADAKMPTAPNLILCNLLPHVQAVLSLQSGASGLKVFDTPSKSQARTMYPANLRVLSHVVAMQLMAKPSYQPHPPTHCDCQHGSILKLNMQR
eukprot:2266914-Amphidinium_carterae.1